MRINRRQLFLGSAAAAAASGQIQPGAKPVVLATGRRFRGLALQEIAFPLGGIGTGTVSLGGYGNLRDWEIFNRPNKGGMLPFTFAAMRLTGGGLRNPVIRVLERQMQPPFRGGLGLPRANAPGLPRFREAVFTGAYPFAEVRFEDARFPVQVQLEAFNPMIPLETDDSSLPVAILTYSVTSRAPSPLDAAIVFSIMNPVGWEGATTLRHRAAPCFGGNLNEFKTEDGAGGMLLSSSKAPPDSARYGSLAVVTPAGDLSYRMEWQMKGGWWHDLQEWWHEFLEKGRFANTPSQPSKDGATEYATMASHVSLNPGETKQIVFVLAWHFPNTENYWTLEKEYKGLVLKNEYGTRWKSAWEPGVYALRNLKSLRERSLRYRDTLYASTLPPSVIDAVSSQASILRTNTVMVLEGKRTLAFEGCNDNVGCCPMNCTHVYNYEQALAFLYPDLERSMRDTDFLLNMRPDGAMRFRTAVPVRPGGAELTRATKEPAADGQMGCVMKVYREWLLSGDDAWLRGLWPQVKRALEYAWVAWDPNRDGVMEGEQHNTYDIQFYGPNTMMGTLYLGALAAAARMARHLGDTQSAETYEALARKGRERIDQLLWNGEFYVQKVDEAQEKAKQNQYGEGCLSDQLLGQWFAEVVNLGKLLPPAHIRATLKSIFRYNFRQSFDEFVNLHRVCALNDEKGLLVCSWPKGKRPERSFMYCDEVWTGIEYQVAAHMFYEGMIKPGLAIVDAVRDRHDGVRRNPWNEVECGHHYARAMASWSLLTALSGFAYSAPAKELRFNPQVSRNDFRSLFSCGTAWGNYSQKVSEKGTSAEIRVEGGKLELAVLKIPFPGKQAKVTEPARATATVVGGEAAVRFASPLRLGKGDQVKVALS